MRRILVVEDSDLLRRIYKLTLTRFELAEFEIGFAVHGKEGVAYLESQPDVDLILLDLDMPVMDGFEFMEICKNQLGLGHIPIVVVSSRTRDAEILRGLEAGAVAYITKPFKEAELHEIIEQILQLEAT